MFMLDLRDRFSFNHHTHDLWEIYDSIKKYYPIGIPRGEGRGIFFEYPGIKRLEEIIIDNVHNKSNYKERWTEFTKEMRRILKMEITDTTFGQAPSFSAYAILEKNVISNCSHYKELHFAISLLGNFYSIYGIDRTVIHDPEGSLSKMYSSANVVTASPYREFKDAFETLESCIRERYPEHKLVPFAFGQTIMDGLRVRYSDAEVCSVNMALFNDFIQPINNFRFTRGYIARSTRGDIYYGLDSWAKS